MVLCPRWGLSWRVLARAGEGLGACRSAEQSYGGLNVVEAGWRSDDRWPAQGPERWGRERAGESGSVRSKRVWKIYKFRHRHRIYAFRPLQLQTQSSLAFRMGPMGDSRNILLFLLNQAMHWAALARLCKLKHTDLQAHQWTGAF